MITLNESTRRSLCRCGFLLLCLAPTLAIAGWSAFWRGAGHLRGYEQALTESLGLRASIERVEHPRPGRVLFRGVVFSDPESGATVAHCRLLEAVTEGDLLVLAPNELEIDARHVAIAWRSLERAMRQEISTPWREFLLAPGSVTVAVGGYRQTYSDVAAHLDLTKGESSLLLEFTLPDGGSTNPARLALSRETDDSELPVTRVEFDCRGLAIPSAILAPFVDSRAWLGTSARFRGVFEATRSAAGWSGTLLEVSLENVDTRALVGDHFRHRLEGLATITIAEAEIRDGKLIAATGTFDGGPGVIGTSLVEQAERRLGMSPGEVDADDAEQVRYERLAFEFEISASGLRIRGLGKEKAALVNTNGRSLLVANGERVEVVQVARALVPESTVQVPATRDTTPLLQWLPVPTIHVGSRGKDPRESRQRLRVTE